jgi:hypothetical protein
LNSYSPRRSLAKYPDESARHSLTSVVRSPLLVSEPTQSAERE